MTVEQNDKHKGFHAVVFWKNDIGPWDVRVSLNGDSLVDQTTKQKVNFIKVPGPTIKRMIAKYGGYPLSSDFWNALSGYTQKIFDASQASGRFRNRLIFAPPQPIR
jgi:hypothetical protein